MRDTVIDLQLTKLPSIDPLQVHYWRGQTSKLVVVLIGVGNSPDVHPPIEFFGSATEGGRHHALFISDKSRSWLNADGIDRQIVDVIQKTYKENDLTEVHLLGNSMGGTMALMLKDQVDARTVLAISPQYSVSPDIVPEETRWVRYWGQITKYRYPYVTLSATAGQTVIIVHGGSPGELIHALRFPKVRGIRHFIVPRANHLLAAKLKRDERLSPLISAAIHDRTYRFRMLIEQSGGVFRQTFEATYKN